MPQNADQQAHDVQPPQQADQAPQQAPPADGEKKLTQEQEGILERLDILEASDHALLAKILKQHPEIRDEIIARANQVCGNDCVAKALQILAGGEEEQATEEEEDGKSADAPQPEPAAPAEVAPQQSAPEQSAPTQSETSEEETEDEAPKRVRLNRSQIARAIKYNESHRHFVRKFNKLTRHKLEGESDEDVDPNVVAKWQAAHGLDPDGKVGPNTIAAALDERSGGESETQGGESEQPSETPPNG